jgi:hypothetical protein
MTRSFIERAPTGVWQLLAGRSLRLQPREDAWLRASRGRLWVTLGEGLRGGERDAGDHVLETGQRMRVMAGQSVVVGSAGPRGSFAAFDWEPAAATAVARPRAAAAARTGWREALAAVSWRWAASLGSALA